MHIDEEQILRRDNNDNKNKYFYRYKILFSLKIHKFSLFDWDRDFYTYIKSHPRSIDNMKYLKSILEDKPWTKRMSKIGTSFFSFLSSWCNYVHNKVVHKENLPWSILPGYNTLL